MRSSDANWLDPFRALAPLARQPFAVLLHDGRCGRSTLYAEPEETLRASGPGALPALRAFLDGARRDGAYVAGLFAYEWGAALDRAPRAPGAAWPDVALGRYGGRVVFEHDARTIRVEGDRPPELAGDETPWPEPGAAEIAAARPRGAVISAIESALDQIRAGDIYQANISQAFAARLAASDTPEAVYARLSAASPAPFAGYFALDQDRAAVTNSPELFLRLGADGRVTSQPIKGTRPRGRTPRDDAALALELTASAKDRAENLMIVDLMRNDLSRVCEPGSIAVPELCALASYANVHHLVSTVTGELADGRGLADLLAASFPPGSITGAPKLKAMETIARLEGEARGPYCGALGHVEPDGSAAFNVMIRTIDFARAADGRWDGVFRAGGGIVAQSDPAAEHQETLDKAAAIAAALGGSLGADP